MSSPTFTVCVAMIYQIQICHRLIVSFIHKNVFHIAVGIMQLKLPQLHLHAIKTAQYSKVKVKLSHNKSRRLGGEGGGMLGFHPYFDNQNK